MLKTGKIALFLASLLLLTGCPYISEIPLAESKNGVVDQTLLGKWAFKPGKYLEFKQINAHELSFQVTERGEQQSRGQAYSVPVGETLFLNMRVINPNNESVSAYMFSRYTIKGDMLLMRVISDDLPDGGYESIDALRSFVQNNLDNPELYAVPDVLTRVVEE